MKCIFYLLVCKKFCRVFLSFVLRSIEELKIKRVSNYWLHLYLPSLTNVVQTLKCPLYHTVAHSNSLKLSLSLLSFLTWIFVHCLMQKRTKKPPHHFNWISLCVSDFSSSHCLYQVGITHRHTYKAIVASKNQQQLLM